MEDGRWRMRVEDGRWRMRVKGTWSENLKESHVDDAAELSVISIITWLEFVDVFLKRASPGL